MNSIYPWTQSPLIVSGPMRLIALAPLAVAVSQAGGLGFLAAGTDVRDLKQQLREAADLVAKLPDPISEPDILPIGVGFINWGLDLETALEALEGHIPAAVWFFAPRKNQDLVAWTIEIRKATNNRTQIWIQIGTVADALEMARICQPDVLVVQGADAGGHGLAQNAGIVSLLPEIADALIENGLRSIPLIAAGGIVEGRGAAACLALGANGVVLGSRFLACEEANVTKGYQDDVLRIRDGGVKTVRTHLYDTLRGTTGWPARYDGRGIINESFIDAQNGKPMDEIKQLHDKALKKGNDGWGKDGRLTAYAGTGVGLIKEVLPAMDIVKEVRQEAAKVLSRKFILSPKL